jgi:hypothetical protein
LNIKIECKAKDLQTKITKAYKAKTERSEMQEWVEERFAHKVGDLDYLTDMEIRSRVEIYYDGGLTQFRSDGGC